MAKRRTRANTPQILGRDPLGVLRVVMSDGTVKVGREYELPSSEPIATASDSPPPRLIRNEPKKARGLRPCPICQTRLNPRNLRRHLSQVHKVAPR